MVICPIQKKNDQMDCNNYRGISVLNTTYKLFSKRLKPFIDEALGEYKIGFRRERDK